MATVYILLNTGVVLTMILLFRRTFRVTCGVFAGLVLTSSSLFHLLYGEGHIADYELYTFHWWADTYEVTVQLTYLVLLLMYSWSLGRVSLIYPINLTYLGAGWVYFWTMTPTMDVTIGYNSLGVLLGSLWTVERLTARTRVAKDDEKVPLTSMEEWQQP